MSREELLKVYEGLNDSERFGIQFGLFPARLLDLKMSTEDTVLLMEIRKERNVHDINKTQAVKKAKQGIFTPIDFPPLHK